MRSQLRIILVLVLALGVGTAMWSLWPWSSVAGVVPQADGSALAAERPSMPSPSDSTGPPNNQASSQGQQARLPPGAPGDAVDADRFRFQESRRQMVERQLKARGIKDPRVLEAMGRVPRHAFVPEPLRPRAYADSPLPIGHEQTISQPYMVALMTELSAPSPTTRALDVGTGSGYQAAVLAEIVDRVYTIEILEPLGRQAQQTLERLEYPNIEARIGDGYQGWPEQAPFDVILLAAAPDHVPQPLLQQLAPGGRFVLPVGRDRQELLVLEKREDGSIEERRVAAVRFVPMTGQAEGHAGGNTK